MVGPLLHERDLYLAWSLKRSKAVNGEHHWGKPHHLECILAIVYHLLVRLCPLHNAIEHRLQSGLRLTAPCQ